MAVDAEYREFLEARMGPLVPLRIKSMFGGFGLYSGEHFFAVADERRLYFKVGDLNMADYDAHDCEWFIYAPGAAPMRYREVPQAVWDEDAELVLWIEKAVAVAEQSKRPRRTRPKDSGR